MTLQSASQAAVSTNRRISHGSQGKARVHASHTEEIKSGDHARRPAMLAKPPTGSSQGQEELRRDDASDNMPNVQSALNGGDLSSEEEVSQRQGQENQMFYNAQEND